MCMWLFNICLLENSIKDNIVFICIVKVCLQNDINYDKHPSPHFFFFYRISQNKEV